MSNLKRVILGLTIACTMAIALVIGLVNMPKPSVNNNTPLNVLDTPGTEGRGYAIIKDSNTFNYSYDAIQQAGEDATKVYEYYFRNTTNAEMAVKMHELECDGLSFKYAAHKTEQTNTSGLTFEDKLNVEPLAPKGEDGDDVYVYVQVTPTSDSVSYSCPIKWTFGYKQTITFKVNGVQQGEPTIGICNYTKVEENMLPDLNLTPQSDFYGWFLDEACTQSATFPLVINSTEPKIYAKVEEYPAGNIPEDSASGWFELNADKASYSIKQGSGTLPANVIIPKTYNNLPVTAIKAGTDSATSVFYSQSSTLTNVTIPSTITSIGDYSFYACSKLSSVTFRGSSQLLSIGHRAFINCKNLTSITLPDGVTSIGDGAFQSCSSLTSIIIPDGVTSIGDQVFYWCLKLTSITLPDNITSIGRSAFATCIGLPSITLPAGLTSIGNSAFNNCPKLSGIILPDSVTSIGSSAFRFCDSLSSITLPDGVTSIDKFTFEYCVSLSSITIPASVTSIGESAFYDCHSLTSVNFGETGGWQVIKNETTTQLSASDLENQTTAAKYLTDTYDDYAWQNNSYATTLGDSWYQYDSTLGGYKVVPGDAADIAANTDVVIAKYYNDGANGRKPVVEISGGIFGGAFYQTEITSVIIPDTVTSIGMNAFSGCSSLNNIIIPESVIKIGGFAFDACSSLTSLVFETSGIWNYTSNISYTGGTGHSIVAGTNYASMFTKVAGLNNPGSEDYWYKTNT